MPDDFSPTALPRPVKTAKIVLFIQGALLVLGTVLLAIGTFSDLGQGQDVEPFAYFALLITLVQAAALLWSAFLIQRRSARLVAIIVESISIAGVLFSVLTAGAFALIGVVLPAVVIAMLNRTEAKDWYDNTENSSAPRSAPPERNDDVSF